MGSIVWLHRHLCKHCRILHIQHLRNKYLDVSRAYLAYSKLRKLKKSQTRMVKRRLLQLLGISISNVLRGNPPKNINNANQ